MHNVEELEQVATRGVARSPRGTVAVLLGGTLVVMTNGCAPGLASMGRAELGRAVRVERGEFDSGAKIKSITVHDGLTYWFLRSVSSVPPDPSSNLHQLYASIAYRARDWRFYERARAPGGRVLAVESIGRKVIGCGGTTIHECDFREDFGVVIDEELLEHGARAGLRIEVAARNGQGALILALTAAYVEAHRQALERYADEQRTFAHDNPIEDIQVGMTGVEVTTLLGEPTSVDRASTARSLLPLAREVAGGTIEVVYRYRNRGRAWLTNNPGHVLKQTLRVTRVEADFAETGHAPR